MKRLDAGAAPTRVRLDIGYDGTAFAGWARQAELRTVQGELEQALSVIFRKHGPTPILTVAGRTDAGVHATGQVAHLDLTAKQCASLVRRRPAASTYPDASGIGSLSRRLNGIAGLNSDVRVFSSHAAPDGFDARFSALWRRYEYRIADLDGFRDPLQRNRTVWHPGRLDVDAMEDAAQELLGLHDWAAYCRPREGATTIRTLKEFTWRREESTGVLVGIVKADAFCHSMVRSLVGAVVAVGGGKLNHGDSARIRDARVRASEFIVMPAKGLTLAEVGYPEDAEVGVRAEQTRNRRDRSVPFGAVLK